MSLMFVILVLLVLLIVAVVAVVSVGGLAVLLVKLGIVVKEASKPAHLDQGDYSIDQGREVRPEEEQVRRRG